MEFLYFSILFFLLNLYLTSILALKSSPSYHPKANSPVLYTPGEDPIYQLDPETFEDTILDPDKPNGFIVEFYADWCGYCRNFMPTFKEFSHQVKSWNEVVKVAAINCADAFNTEVCCANGIQTIPTMKYFPRKARNYSEGINLAADSHSAVSDLKNEVVSFLTKDYAMNRYQDWPNFEALSTDSSSIENLWSTNSANNYKVIIFEKDESNASQLLLDLYPYKNYVSVHRAEESHPLSNALQVLQFPYVAVFRKSDQKPIFESTYSNLSTLYEILSRTVPEDVISTTQKTVMTTQALDLINCQNDPEKCKNLYYVSETDLLKSMYSALLGDIIRKCDFIQGQNFTDLKNFVGLLAEHFPTKSAPRYKTLRAKRAENPATLERSERARQMFEKLKTMLDDKPGNMSVQEWKDAFEKLEFEHGSPFPVNSTWQHCKGSTPLFRGYSCGLWTTFHTLTVYTYMDKIREPSFDNIAPLKAIQGWVRSFMWCTPCRKHFINMTTLDNELPMDERNIRTKEDLFLYLWKAHNRVNKRLHSDDNKFTEDPQFVKNPFPPKFLCSTCHMEDQPNVEESKEFLLNFYSNIRPHQEDTYVDTNEVDSYV